jgi:carbamate kinase
MRIVIALGGNALLLRGEELSMENQRRNVRVAAAQIAPVTHEHEVVITHGNGPQVGLLALQSASLSDFKPYPLDVLGAQTEGMIGYLIEQELGNLLPFEQPFATILTMVEVDAADPAFENPTKPIGPVYDEPEARSLAAERGWSIARDGDGWRRVVPSPQPLRVFEIRPIRWLLDRDVIVICAGGGGIPTVYHDDGTLHGAEVVIDKDRASALLAREVGAELLIMATDVEGVYEGWGTDDARLIRHATPDDLLGDGYAEGSMGPKVEAACEFASLTGGRAVIGSVSRLGAMVAGESGTIIQAG